MTTISSRLGRLTGGLSGHERAILVLRALHAGQEPDPQLRIIDDPVQAGVFDRCMAYIQATNSELNSIVYDLDYHATWLGENHVIALLTEVGELHQRETGEIADPRVVKAWRKAKTVNAAELMFGVAEEVRSQMLEQALDLYRSLQAVGLLRQELVEEFGGEDLCLPEVQALEAQAAMKVKALLDRFQAPKRLPEPDEERIAALRQRLEQVFRFWNLIEMRPESPR